MDRSHWRTSAVLPLVLCFALAVPAAAEGVGLGEGDRAAPFEGKEFVNTDPVSLKSLRGRMVLLELFSTT